MIGLSIEEVLKKINMTLFKKIAQGSGRNRNEFVMGIYKIVSEFFPPVAQQIIEKALVVDTRWKDLDVVTDRLNSPELVDHYERSRIRYHYEPGHLDDYRHVFRYNEGHCMMITAFTRYCLHRAGYKARNYNVTDSDLSPGGYHHRACLFEVNGRKYIMDNGRGHPLGIVRFEDYEYHGHRWSYESYHAVWEEFQ